MGEEHLWRDGYCICKPELSGKKLTGKRSVNQNMVLGESFADALDSQKDEQVVLDEIKPELSLEAKITKLRLWYFGHIVRTQVSGSQ